MKTYKFRINGNEYNVEINSVEGNIADVTVNGAAYQVEMDASASSATGASMVGEPCRTTSSATGAPASSVASTGSATGTTGRNAAKAVASTGSATVEAPAAKQSAPAGAGKPVTSPLPGVIIEVSVKEGQAVKAGQKVAVLEAMKMENEIQAPADGTVTAILVNKGDSVLEGAEIVKIA